MCICFMFHLPVLILVSRELVLALLVLTTRLIKCRWYCTKLQKTTCPFAYADSFFGHGLRVVDRSFSNWYKQLFFVVSLKWWLCRDADKKTRKLAIANKSCINVIIIVSNSHFLFGYLHSFVHYLHNRLNCHTPSMQHSMSRWHAAN